MKPESWALLGACAAIFVLVVVGQAGVILLKRDPKSAWGLRLAVIGIASKRALLAVGQRFAPARVVAESLPDFELPAGSTAIVEAKEGGGATISVDHASAVDTQRVGKLRVPRVPRLPMILLPLALLASCDRGHAITAANAQHAVGHATAHTLDALCNYEAADKMEGGAAAEHVRRLDERGCRQAWEAQTAFAKAHEAQVAAIQAAEKGECMIGTPRAAPACNLLGIATKTYQAGRALADAVAAVKSAAGDAQ